MLLSVVIPAFNEEQRIPLFLPKLISKLNEYCPRSFEIIIVDDGSTDRTAQISQQLLGNYGRILRLPQNYGKGRAMRTGVMTAQAQYVCITDADGSIGMTAFSQAMGILQSSALPGVIGTRYLGNQDLEIAINWKRLIAGKAFAQIARLILGLHYSDTQCGFKAFNTPFAKRLFEACKSEKFGIDFELLYISQINGIRYVELPVEWREMPDSKVRIFTDGFRMLREMLQLRFAEKRSLQLPIYSLDRVNALPVTADLDESETFKSNDNQKKDRITAP